jgi:hypothetical protein
MALRRRFPRRPATRGRSDSHWHVRHLGSAARLAGDIHLREFPEPLARLRERKVTPGQFFIDACDEKFTDEDLSDLGNRFAEHYYEHDDAPGHYFSDYAATVGTEAPSIYHVPDTWEIFEQVAPVIQQRFEEWLRT